MYNKKKGTLVEDPEDSREEQSEEGRIGGQVRERDWNLDFAVQARYYSGVLQFWGARCFFVTFKFKL